MQVNLLDRSFYELIDRPAIGGFRSVETAKQRPYLFPMAVVLLEIRRSVWKAPRGQQPAMIAAILRNIAALEGRFTVLPRDGRQRLSP